MSTSSLVRRACAVPLISALMPAKVRGESIPREEPLFFLNLPFYASLRERP
jgi:hypothetical protein